MCWKKRDLAGFLLISFSLMYHNGNAQTYLDTTATIDARVKDLLSRMTLEEKIGQIIQTNYPDLPSPSDITTYYLGSVLASADAGPEGKTPQAWADLNDTLQTYALKTRLGIPLLFGIDAVHGIGSVYGATIFPHNIGMGCTRNADLVKQSAQITATEVAATGINMTFGPVVAVARNENWGRTYESFGEEPNVVKAMAAAAVQGFQGDTSAKNITILACAKHFIGDGGTTGGQDGGNTQLDTATLKAIHLPGYISAIEQKVGSIMVSFSSWNNVRCVANKYLLTTLLKEELKFKGLLITDFDGIFLAPGTTSGEQFNNSINAGIDMVMLDGTLYVMFINSLKTSVGHGIPLDRIDDAVRRILTQKFRLGLFEHPFAKRSLLSQVGSPEHRQVARECVRQSLVVLKKKDGVLPILKNIKHILMAGRHANNLGYQCGGWTMSWQGGSGSTTIGTTILQAVQQVVSTSTKVTYSEEGFGAESADIGIAVIGETPYAEGAGDGRLYLDPADVQTIRRLKSHNIPVIVILISGRPLILDPVVLQCDAVIAAWLPGTEGEGITDVLFGDYQPTGILSQTWPKDAFQIPINVGDAVYNPLFAFGYGITSLSNSPAGSSPEVYSASTTLNGRSIELSFNKKMIPPSAPSSGLSVLTGGSTSLTITDIHSKATDSTTIVLSFANGVQREKAYTISYTPGTIQSNDHGLLLAFTNLPVYNILNDCLTIPGKIEAEECYAYQGMYIIYPCSDVGAGSCLSHIRNGDYADYSAYVSQSGKYTLGYRISSYADTGQIQLMFDGTLVSTLTLPSIGSWDNWQTVSTTVELSEGLQLIRMYASHGGFQLNWMQFSLNTGVEEQTTAPHSFQLYQNYPNPLNPSTTIRYSLPNRSRVKLQVFNMLGQVVTELANNEQSAGYHSVIWNASVASGMYFYRIESIDVSNPNNRFVNTKKMILLK